MVNTNDFVPGSRYFRWKEFFRSATAEARGIDNVPRDAEVLKNISYLTDKVLNPLREALGPLRVSSGYRCNALNQAIGGSRSSFHSFGMAADIMPTSDNPHSIKEIFQYIHDNLPYTELIAEDIPDGWVHVAIARGRENEKQLKYKLKGQGVKRGTYPEILELFR